MTINREAADKAKGFRLQKIRAIKFMMKALIKSQSNLFYTAIENVEDVSHSTIDENGVSTHYEEDKNYDPNESFTLNSPAVKNTLVSFFDIYWGQWKDSQGVTLGFYTTASIGKEVKKVKTATGDIPPPSEPILKLLSSKEDLLDEAVKYIKEVLYEEYSSQYDQKNKQGHLLTLKNMTLDQFKLFLKQIHWEFGADDHEKAEFSAKEAIRTSPLYDLRVENKEDIIFSLLIKALSKEVKPERYMAMATYFYPMNERHSEKASERNSL